MRGRFEKGNQAARKLANKTANETVSETVNETSRLSALHFDEKEFNEFVRRELLPHVLIPATDADEKGKKGKE